MTGFRQGLCTQDAMLLLKRAIYDRRTSDTKAILGLDLQGAFDNVKHASILEQISALNMGERTFAYVKAFLSDRTITIHAGDLELPTKRIPSVHYNLYADDITIWAVHGSDGQIEEALQQAVQAVECSLDGTGLICSPTKSELLVIAPSRTRYGVQPNINLHTADGSAIPRKDTLRVLGMHIQANGANSHTVQRLLRQITAAMTLIRKVATRHAGMPEASALRLVQAFVVSHVAYVAAYHN
ncbi:uncharacterized protein LOC144143457 [Haemaphysalis longicornis]